MTRRRQLLKAGALGATASFTTGAYAQTQPSVRWRPDGHPNSPVYGHLKLPHLN